MKTQNAVIREHLESGQKITPLEALTKYGVMRLSRVVGDLKEDGMLINSELVSTKNRYGKSVRVAEYSVIHNIEQLQLV